MKYIQNHSVKFLLFYLLFFHQIVAQDFTKKHQSTFWYKGDTVWAREKLNDMSLDERLGQLFMLATYSNKGDEHQNEILKLIKEQNIGGLIFFQGSPEKQVKLTNLYQQSASIPLMIAIDAEWGLAMRLDKTFKFPWPITVGAVEDSILAYQVGQEVAKHCKRLGIHINLAPVVDINTNPNNPIINARSFGENPKRVSRFSAAYLKGIQDEGVMACAKHFPGHGDTDEDSHKTLPTVNHSLSRLDSIELYPYKKLIPKGLASIMVGHLNVPALDNSGRASSLSSKVIQKFLKGSLGFDGLVFTDALNMGGITRNYRPGEVDVQALLAGNDILVFSQDVVTAKSKIKTALKSQQISEEEINKKVYKILLAKSWLGLKKKTNVELTNIVSDLNTESSQLLNRKIYEKAITVLLNRGKTIPVKELANNKVACVTAGTEVGNEFVKTLKYYTDVHSYIYDKDKENELLNVLSNYDLVIIGIYTSNVNPWKSYHISDYLKNFVKKINLQNKVILNVFANPYSLKYFPEAQQVDVLIMSYQNHFDAESLSAQIIFGALGAEGKLPVTVSPLFREGFGLNTPNLSRLGYGLPVEVGFDPERLGKIDKLVNEAIVSKAIPGCQVLVARKGKVVFHKAYGYHTYYKEEEVTEFNLYDLASITKIGVSVPLLMKMVEEDKLNIDKTLSCYLPELKGTNKKDLIIKEILTHQARLQGWIPFYLNTLKNGAHMREYYSKVRSFDYPNIVGEELYSNRFVRDTILKTIINSKLLSEKDYKYSDLGYYLFMELIEKIEGRSLDELVTEKFYNPIGAYTMTYNPLEKFLPEKIIPTENDEVFRKQNLRGYVHDQGAAMLGGIAGHSGLFSNANDLAKLMQVYLQKGQYGGIRFFDSVTVKEFTRCQYCEMGNRRGIGFDKPQLKGPGPTCKCVSPLSFGHTGFTGTIAWSDPHKEVVYVFLSNRIYPSVENRKLLTLSTRVRIQEVIYNSLKDEYKTNDSKFSGAAQP